MDKDTLDFAIEKTKELIAIPFCSSLIKSEAQIWLDCIGTEKESEETKKYIGVLESEIMPIDTVIAFAGSEQGAKILGEEKAKLIERDSKALKEKGAEYCGCDACRTAMAIIEKKDLLVK